MTRSRTRVLALPISLAVVLGVSACGASEDDAIPEGPTTTEEEAAADAEAPEETEEPATEADPAAACLVGDWAVDIEGDILTQQALVGGEVNAISVTGDATLTFDEGDAVRRTLDDVEAEVDITTFGARVEVWSRQQGTVTGSYAVDGDALAITDTDNSGLTLEQRALVDGEETEIPVDLAALAQDEHYTFTCTDTELRLVPDFSGLGSEALDELDPEDFATVLTRR